MIGKNDPNKDHDIHDTHDPDRAVALPINNAIIYDEDGGSEKKVDHHIRNSIMDGSVYIVKYHPHRDDDNDQTCTSNTFHHDDMSSSRDSCYSTFDSSCEHRVANDCTLCASLHPDNLAPSHHNDKNVTAHDQDDNKRGNHDDAKSVDRVQYHWDMVKALEAHKKMTCISVEDELWIIDVHPHDSHRQHENDMDGSTLCRHVDHKDGGMNESIRGNNDSSACRFAHLLPMRVSDLIEEYERHQHLLKLSLSQASQSQQLMTRTDPSSVDHCHTQRRNHSTLVTTSESPHTTTETIHAATVPSTTFLLSILQKPGPIELMKHLHRLHASIAIDAFSSQYSEWQNGKKEMTASSSWIGEWGSLFMQNTVVENTAAAGSVWARKSSLAHVGNHDHPWQKEIDMTISDYDHQQDDNDQNGSVGRGALVYATIGFAVGVLFFYGWRRWSLTRSMNGCS